MNARPTTLLLLVLRTVEAGGQTVDTLRLTIDKRGMEEACAAIECRFALTPPPGADSVALRFGSSEWSVDDLTVSGSGLDGWHYRPESQRLVLYPAAGAASLRIEMRYDYLNLGDAIVYGRSGAEIWETGFGEWWYPQLAGATADLEAEWLLPDSLLLVAAHPVTAAAPGRVRTAGRRVPVASLSFALLQRDRYVRRTIAIPDSVEIWQLRGREAPPERLAELEELTAASIAWFGALYGAPYATESIRPPRFVFHGGQGFANRNNFGFISASQEKFASYPDIWPLVHEIGHRWLGEWTLRIADGEPGAYFLKETLDEWMTLRFLHARGGEELYREQLERCRREWAPIAGTEADRRLVDMTRNNNETIVYRKGPLLLDALAQQVGYDRLTEAIAAFYRAWHDRPGLTIDAFVATLRRSAPDIADGMERILVQ